MKRVYVIMTQEIHHYSVPHIEPFDVVSTMKQADQICEEQNLKDSKYEYYWREVISSEEE